MTEEEKSEIKNRLSDIGAKVEELALNYIENLEKENAELKAHCKAVDEVNEKMKCCGNCKYNEIYEGEEFCNNKKGVCKYYSKTFKEDNWELAE